MTYRSALCTHCSHGSADHECTRCGRPACRPCVTAPCPLPHSREFRLGRGARLRAVDRGGRHGVVTSWRRAVRVVDMQHGGYRKPGDDFPPGRAPFGAVTRGGHWLCTVPRWDTGSAAWTVGLADLLAGATTATYLTGVTQLGLCDRDETAWLLMRDETITLMSPAGRRLRVVDPHGPEVTQAVAYDARTDLLWTGAHSRILASRVMNRLRGDERANRRYRTEVIHRIPLEGEDIYWVRAAGGRVAYTSRWMWGAQDPHAALDAVRLRVHDITDEGVRTPPRLDITAPPAATADLSLDGRHVAVASSPSTVDVYDLESRTKQVLGGHSDLIHFVWFTDEGGLITADYDNRVIVWVRGGNQYLPVVDEREA